MNEKQNNSINSDLEEYFVKLMTRGISQIKTPREDGSISLETEQSLKSSIYKVLDTEQKYRFLIHHVNEIVFKSDIITFDEKNVLQEIMQDITNANKTNYETNEINKKQLEGCVREIFKSEERYRFLIEHIGEIIFICNHDFMFSYLNPQWQTMLGYSIKDSLETCLFDYIHKDDLPLIQEKLNRLIEGSTRIVNFEYRLRNFKGTWKHHLMTCTPIVDFYGQVTQMLGVSRDISERKILQHKIRDYNKRLERKVCERTTEINSAYKELQQINTKLIQSEKMAAVGELSSGIAHEFNNIIGIMQAYAEFARCQPTEKNRNKLIEAVLLSSDRAKTIIQSLLGFSRRIEPLQELANINDAIEDVLVLLETELKKTDITVVKKLDLNLPKIIFDIGQIEQVLLNLLVNAKHALLQNKNSSNKKIIIRTFEKDRYIKLSISDNGIGIKKCHLDKIFQPFFSTKGAHGKSKIPGTGLGLSVSLGIIENHHGNLKVTSKENSRTTFTISIPKNFNAKPIDKISKLVHDNYSSSKKENKISTTPHLYKKTANILVVDDEEYLRNALCDILSSEGYNLIPAEDGETAVNLFKDSHFDLVLMDIMMPGIDGFETIKMLRAINSNIKVLIISGSSHFIPVDSLKEHDVQGVVFKPFELNKLLVTISKILDSST